MKNRPSNKPLNGSMVTSTSRRYSVSANKSPATKAPSDMDSPAAAAATLEPVMTSRQAATKNSVERACATWLNSGRITSLPMPKIATSPMKAGKSVVSNWRASPVSLETPAETPSIVIMNRNGATIRS